jgi:hypothetical protein
MQFKKMENYKKRQLKVLGLIKLGLGGEEETLKLLN